MQLFVVFAFGLICLSAVSAAPHTPEQVEFIKGKMKICMAEAKLDHETLEKAKEGDGLDKREIHCFASCMMTEMNIMDNEGKINLDAVLSYVPDTVSKDELTKIVNLCSEAKGDDLCQKAGNMIVCFHKNKGGELFRLPQN